MRLAELHELLQNGESSGVEFKRDTIHPDSLAKEIAAELNSSEGTIKQAIFRAVRKLRVSMADLRS